MVPVVNGLKGGRIPFSDKCGEPGIGRQAQQIGPRACLGPVSLAADYGISSGPLSTKRSRNARTASNVLAFIVLQPMSCVQATAATW